MDILIAGFIAGWVSYTFSYQYMSPKRRAWYTDNIVSVWLDLVFGIAPMMFIGASFGSVAFAIGTSIGLSGTMFVYAWANKHYPSEEAVQYRHSQNKDNPSNLSPIELYAIKRGYVAK